MSSSRKRPPEEGNEGAEKREKRNKDAVRTHKLHGLYNQGATCYLNSVLQVLSMTTEIHKRLNTSLHADQELRNIFETLKKSTCGTEIITKSLDITNVHQQRDAAECLEMILHKVSPEASEVFRGELKCSTKCSEGHSIIEETNPFLTLPLSLKDAHDTNYSVERGFEKIFQKTSFSGDNMVYCNKCTKKTDATSECEMVKFPKILTLLLKRFVFDYNAMSHVKSDRSVDVPSELQKKNKTYKLYGIVNHMGGLRGGHYTATILSNEDQTWYEFDDTRVEKVDEQPFSKTETYKSRTAYLLMYRDTGRTKKTGRQGKVSHVDEQKENKVKGNSRLEPNQDGQRELRQVTKEEALKHKVRKVDGDEIYIKEDNAVFSSGQHPKAWMPEARRKQSNKKYEFDDTHVEKVDEQPFAKTETYNSRTAYPLMYRATGSPITNRTERQDEVSHVDEQKGNKVKGNSHLEQNQGSQREIRKAKKKEAPEAPDHKLQAVDGDERYRKVSPFEEDIIKADNAVHQNQNSSSRQHPKTWMPESRITHSSKKHDVRLTVALEENPQQPCKRTASILKKPLVIVVIVFVCALIVILPVVLTSLRK